MKTERSSLRAYWGPRYWHIWLGMGLLRRQKFTDGYNPVAVKFHFHVIVVIGLLSVNRYGDRYPGPSGYRS